MKLSIDNLAHTLSIEPPLLQPPLLPMLVESHQPGSHASCRVTLPASRRTTPPARQKYIEENEKEILEAAAEQYNEEHEEVSDFKEAAVRLKAEEL